VAQSPHHPEKSMTAFQSIEPIPETERPNVERRNRSQEGVHRRTIQIRTNVRAGIDLGPDNGQR
jgi:hypothetical protein